MVGSKPPPKAVSSCARLGTIGVGGIVLDVALSIQQGEDALEALLDGLPEGSSRRERRALHEGLHG